jgi:hypothetical protein
MLKEIMGESYKEGMSKDDIQAFFKKQVLSSGDYTNSGKANAEKKELNDKIAALQAELDSKMTDDDKKKKADAETQNLIKKLQKELSESRSNQSKMSALAHLAEAKTQAGIESEDAEFDEFISNISFEDKDKTDKVSKYVATLVKNAYEAGKKSSDKKDLAQMGAFKSGSDSSSDEKGAFGKQLAQSTKVETKGQKDFFERK